MRQTLRVTPETRYATTTDGVRIAYQVFGEGRRTLILCLGMISCVDYQWEVPEVRDALERMARFARVVAFDRRGAGSSDRFSGGDAPPLELGVEDVGAVLAETGDQEVCLWGHHDGALVAALYAATHPERVEALGLHCPDPYARQSPDWPWGWNEEEWAATVGAIAEGWGTVEHTRAALQWVAPSLTPTTARLDRIARYFRLAGSPSAMAALQRVLRDTDIRAVLPSIQTQTLITHRGSPEVYAVEVSRYVAEQIPHARLVELDGPDFALWADPAPICAEIEEFLLGTRISASSDRVLSTLLFTDIVDSTIQLERAGDSAWASLLGEHQEHAQRLISEHRGVYSGDTGDGLLARFDGPARAVRCGLAIQQNAAELGLGLRAGCHTGEIEVAGDALRGIAVHTAARICASAEAGELRTSVIVRDLTAGSGLVYRAAGEYKLKGVPGTWPLYSVAP